MSRPCQWPDGGCGAEVEFYPTGKLKADGKPVLQVIDAAPEKRIVLVFRDGHPGAHKLAPPGTPPELARARVADTYVDHHSTCPKWLAKIGRERATKAAKP